MSKSVVLVVHGGAGTVSEFRINPKLEGVQNAVQIGYEELLKDNGSALDAVEKAVRYMEDSEYFNAGYGSVLNLGYFFCNCFQSTLCECKIFHRWRS